MTIQQWFSKRFDADLATNKYLSLWWPRSLKSICIKIQREVNQTPIVIFRIHWFMAVTIAADLGGFAHACHVQNLITIPMYDPRWKRSNGPLARYVQLRVAHAAGMPETFSPPPRVSDSDMYHVTHVPCCMPGSLTSDLRWSQWVGKTFPALPAQAQPAILHVW